MKSKLLLPFAFLLFLNASKAQIHYTDEEIKNKYDHETMILDLDGVEKNGLSTHFNYLFPPRQLKTEIEKNGGIASNGEYQKYRKNVATYWIISILGIIGILLFTSLIIGSATTGNLATLSLLYLGFTLGITLFLLYLSKRAFRHLSRSIWWYNRNVLLKK